MIWGESESKSRPIQRSGTTVVVCRGRESELTNRAAKKSVNPAVVIPGGVELVHHSRIIDVSE